jgi:thioredoxin domain-containing protein 5
MLDTDCQFLDLCDAHKVKGYPTINLYRNGEYVEQYKKARDLPLLLEYTSLHAEKKKKAPAATPTPPKPLEPKPKADPAPEKHTPAQDWNPSGTVTVLTPNNFHSFTSKGPVFVKFYAPWCGHCKKLAPHWTRLAEHMRHKMTIAEMDCDAHSKFCQKQNIEGFPALFFYPGPEADRSEYMGGRKFEHLSAFAEKATEP